MIGKIIQQKRKDAGLTQAQLAELLGVTAPAVNRWEKDLSFPDATLLAPLARCLKTDLNELFSFYDSLSDKERELTVEKATRMLLEPDDDKVLAYIEEMLRQNRSDGQLHLGMAKTLYGAHLLKKAYAPTIYFHKICRSVYNDDELHEMEHEARILTGQEHSNVLSMSFTGYQVPFGVSFLNRSMPSVVITPKGVRFNKAAHTRMNNCSHIEILYHPVMQTIAIRPCDEDHANAVRWEDEEGNMTHAFTSRAFAEAIYENMRWRTDLSFKFRLVPRERDGVTILMASLDEPQIKLDKKTKELLGLTEESGPVQYIVHKVAESVPADSFTGRLQQVDNSFGVSLALRKRRDQMSASITVADIQRQIQIVDNPLIGQLPTRAEMAEELDDLLMCM